jgi:hypothetical protein
MELRLIREPSVAGATLGALYVDDVWTCWTLEDELREIPGLPVAAWKVWGQTAIPAGRYQVRVTWSPRFRRELPELVDVPGYTGIRMHIGNRPADTEGCVLVGLRRAAGAVLDSRVMLEALVPRLQAVERTGELIWIDVENPRSYRPPVTA